MKVYVGGQLVDLYLQMPATTEIPTTAPTVPEGVPTTTYTDPADTSTDPPPTA